MNNQEKYKPWKFQDITGLRCGLLTVVKLDNIRENGIDIWECICDCGKTRFYPSGALLHRTVESCGCLLPTKKQEFDRLVGLAKEKKADISNIIDKRRLFILEQRHIHNRTLRDVGNELGVTLERIRQIENDALRKLRWALDN